MSHSSLRSRGLSLASFISQSTAPWRPRIQWDSASGSLKSNTHELHSETHERFTSREGHAFPFKVTLLILPEEERRAGAWKFSWKWMSVSKYLTGCPWRVVFLLLWSSVWGTTEAIYTQSPRPRRSVPGGHIGYRPIAAQQSRWSLWRHSRWRLRGRRKREPAVIVIEGLKVLTFTFPFVSQIKTISEECYESSPLLSFRKCSESADHLWAASCHNEGSLR